MINLVLNSILFWKMKNGDFYQRVWYMEIKLRVEVWTIVTFLEGIEY